MTVQVSTNPQVIDLVVVICANIFNIMMVIIFLQRALSSTRSTIIYVLIEIALAITLSVAAIYNWTAGRSLWMILLPALMVVFLIVELLLDNVLKIEFRKTRLLGPYLLFYYAAQMGLIGYAFIVNRVFGFITLITYFLSLAATGYSYKKVGHGVD
jgi:hypothetical protein